jgi:hypothetical protein
MSSLIRHRPRRRSGSLCRAVGVAGALVGALLWVPIAAAIPATRLMTVYQFDGPLELPTYRVDDFARNGTRTPAGALAQGSSVIPCLVVRNGAVLTDHGGAPFVGFEVVVDARSATPADAARFAEVSSQRKSLQVASHVCAGDVRDVIDARRLFALDRAPRFEPPQPGSPPPVPAGRGDLDRIVREFHASAHCAAANRRLPGRRRALERAWDDFAGDNAGRWPRHGLATAEQLDYVMRTAIYEGHIDRGCSSYGACERNVIALSIRNRAVERCRAGQGCGFSGDFQGVASAVSQYNIWDELLTQTSGLTSCFLRPDLAAADPYAKLQAMYEQSAPDVERLLFGGEAGLRRVFPGNAAAELKSLRHYYHPPAMGPCFPAAERLEYISAAVASRGDARALLANTRIRVDQERGGGYAFRMARVEQKTDGDVIHLTDDYPGFVVDGRKVALQAPARCAPYGTPTGCHFERIGRRRKTPSWLTHGVPVQLTCRVESRGADCGGAALTESSAVGGVCDTRMQPIAGVP